MSITNKLNQIKNAIYGKEVRGAIHDAIKQVYDDATVNHDNANMEVKMARGTHNTLNDRLNKTDEIQAQTNARLSQKADKSEIGSPMVADSISSMTDTSKIYVNTADGNWYSYNGSNWVSGGLYNSQGIADNSIEGIHLKGGVKSFWLYEYPKTCVEGKFIDTKGVINSHPEGVMCKINTMGDTTYSIWMAHGQYTKNVGLGLFMNSDEEVIKSFELSEYINGSYNGVQYVTITTPSDCCYLCFNVKTLAFDDSFSTIVCEGEEIKNDGEIYKIFNKELADNYARNFLKTIKTNNMNIYSKSQHYVDGKYVHYQGHIDNGVNWGLAKIPVEKNTEYSLCLPFGDYTGTIGALSFFSGNTLVNHVYPITSLLNGHHNGMPYITFTTPDNCDSLAITCKRPDIFDDSDSLILVKGSSIPRNFSYDSYISEINGYKLCGVDIELNEKLEEMGCNSSSPSLFGKKWVVVGDSLTEKNFRAAKNYHDYIADKTGVKVVNMGLSGSGYKKREDVNNAFYQRIKNVPLDADIVTIFGSGNDLSFELGNVDDTGTDTLCGCINTTLDNLYAIMPAVKLGVITPCPWGSYPPHIPNNKMALYSNALVEICKRRSIPCLDLYHESNMRPWDEKFRELMYKKDDGGSVHPDEDGHEFMSNRFLSFISSL